MTDVKYPEISINLDLSGPEGNAFYILGKVCSELKAINVDSETEDEYTRQAISGTYNELIQTTSNWVNVRCYCPICSGQNPSNNHKDSEHSV